MIIGVPRTAIGDAAIAEAGLRPLSLQLGSRMWTLCDQFSFLLPKSGKHLTKTSRSSACTVERRREANGSSRTLSGSPKPGARRKGETYKLFKSGGIQMEPPSLLSHEDQRLILEAYYKTGWHVPDLDSSWSVPTNSTYRGRTSLKPSRQCVKKKRRTWKKALLRWERGYIRIR